MTVCFNIDCCKLSHTSLEVVVNIITWLKNEYESIFEYGSGEMTVHQGNVHNNLGMALDYTEGGT